MAGLWDRAKQVPVVASWLALMDDFHGALSGKPPDATKTVIDTLGAVPLPVNLLIAQTLSALTGKPLAGNQVDLVNEAQAMLKDPNGYLAKKVAEIQSNPEFKASGELLANLMSSGVVEALKGAAETGVREPMELLTQVLAAATAAKVLIHSVGVGAEILGLGQIQTVDAALEDVLHSLNVDRIIEHLLEPLFSSGLVPPAERFYNARFRNARLSAQDLVVLNRFGVVSDGDLKTEAAQEGWRDEDLERIKELARARVTPADALDARELGLIDDQALIAKLMEFRYSHDDAVFIADLAATRRHQDWNERIFQLALREFTKYLIDADKLADIARRAGFSQERIDVEMAVAKATLESQKVELTLAEIEAAFKANKLGEQETVTYLNKIHIDPSGIPILLETWKATRQAGGTHLNADQLVRAFHAGLLNETELLTKLEDLGWNASDARLIVQIAQWQRPEKPRELSEAIISSAFTDGVLSHDEAVARLKDLGFSEDDADTILRVHVILPKTKQKELTAAEIAKAVELGILPEEEALNRLEHLGYSSDDAAILYAVLTTKPPKAVKSKPPPATE